MAFPWYDEGKVVDPATTDFQLTHDESRVGWDEGRIGLGKSPSARLAIPYDQGRIVHDPDASHFFVHDEGRLAVADDRLLVDPLFLHLRTVLYHDQGRVVDDQVNAYLFVHDRRIAIDTDRPLVGTTDDVPLIPLVPTVDGERPEIEDFAIGIRIGH